VVGPGIVEVDGLFDEAQSEDDRIEVQIPLGVTGNCGYMMQADDWFD
jgi:hypothetical protein